MIVRRLPLSLYRARPRLYEYLTSVHVSCARCRSFRDVAQPFRKYDVVLLRSKPPRKLRMVTKPLAAGLQEKTPFGMVDHKDIIGKQPQQTIQLYPSHGGSLSIENADIEVALEHASLADYIDKGPRAIKSVRLPPRERPSQIGHMDASSVNADWPVWGDDIIVSLLDINLTPPSLLESQQYPFEILEASSTGSVLTLHLARAIAAGNLPSPHLPSHYWFENGRLHYRERTEDAQENAGQDSGEDTAKETGHPGLQLVEAKTKDENAPFERWRMRRNAIVHKVELSPHWCRHAQTVVRNFRNGLYYPHVDFYPMYLGEWVNKQQERRALPYRRLVETQFLDRVVMDLTTPHKMLLWISSALRTDGMLIVLADDPEDLAQCGAEIRARKLPLDLVRTLKLGPEVGGSDWEASEGRRTESRSRLRRTESTPKETFLAVWRKQHHDKLARIMPEIRNQYEMGKRRLKEKKMRLEESRGDQNGRPDGFTYTEGVYDAADYRGYEGDGAGDYRGYGEDDGYGTRGTFTETAEQRRRGVEDVESTSRSSPLYSAKEGMRERTWSGNEEADRRTSRLPEVVPSVFSLSRSTPLGSRIRTSGPLHRGPSPPRYRPPELSTPVTVERGAESEHGDEGMSGNKGELEAEEIRDAAPESPTTPPPTPSVAASSSATQEDLTTEVESSEVNKSQATGLAALRAASSPSRSSIRRSRGSSIAPTRRRRFGSLAFSFQ
ncbi:MAG: hypothetical protein M1823_001477 [Watsoniomyces obsoletus]|nr:MAG: hypothetical protein M1823_001477 [Watsoniomyces obsoletus]